jgi:hypothetical protein
VRKRAEAATRNLRTLLERPALKPSADRAGRGLGPCAKLLLELNRNLGFLENTVVALEQGKGVESTARKKSLLASCIQSARATDKRIRQTLRCMALSARKQADAAKPGSPEAESAGKKADLYETLSESESYAGTGLEHPFLAAAVAEAATKARARSAGGDERGEEG